jgi:3-polyprenyl-4-hydroxybenzoate decarboxylase
MGRKVQMNANVLPQTKERVAELAEITLRGNGDVIDLAVAQLYERVTGRALAVSMETAPATEVPLKAFKGSALPHGYQMTEKV